MLLPTDFPGGDPGPNFFELARHAGLLPEFPSGQLERGVTLCFHVSIHPSTLFTRMSARAMSAKVP